MAGQQKEAIKVSWAATLLALPSIGVFFLADILAHPFAWQGTGPKFAEMTVAMARQDAAGRFFMLAAALASFAIAYLIILRFVADLRDEFNAPTRAWILGWYGGGVVVGAIWVATGCQQVPMADQLGKGFLKEALDHLDNRGLLPSLEHLAICSRIAIMLAAGIVVTGGVSALAEPRTPLKGDAAHAFLEHQHRRLRGYVNAAAALLVVSLVFQIAWTRWPLAALDPASAKAVIPHVDAFAAYTGVTGSLVILLFAAPVATMLAERAARLPARATAAATPPLLDSGILASLGKIFAVLAPTLAGLAPGVLDLLGKTAGS